MSANTPEQTYRSEAFSLHGLWKKLYIEDKPYKVSEHPHWGNVLPLHFVWKKLHSKGRSCKAPEIPHPLTLAAKKALLKLLLQGHQRIHLGDESSLWKEPDYTNKCEALSLHQMWEEIHSQVTPLPEPDVQWLWLVLYTKDWSQHDWHLPAGIHSSRSLHVREASEWIHRINYMWKSTQGDNVFLHQT